MTSFLKVKPLKNLVKRMSERVVGYVPKEVEIVVSRPCKWHGDTRGEFTDKPPVTIKKTLLSPIYEDMGAHVNTTMDDPLIGIAETPLWGVNTDDATGKHRKGNIYEHGK